MRQKKKSLKKNLPNRGPRPTPRGLRFEKEKNEIMDHASPQKGFGLSAPRGVEGRAPMVSNTRPGRQRERVQGTAHQASRNLAFTSRHRRISNRSPNQNDIAGKNGAHSSTNRPGTSGQEAERIQELRHANATDSCRVKSVNMQRPPEKEMLDAVPAALHQGVLPSSGRWQFTTCLTRDEFESQILTNGEISTCNELMSHTTKTFPSPQHEVHTTLACILVEH
jgi:hypothetical protein